MKKCLDKSALQWYNSWLRLYDVPWFHGSHDFIYNQLLGKTGLMAITSDFKDSWYPVNAYQTIPVAYGIDSPV